MNKNPIFGSLLKARRAELRRSASKVARDSGVAKGASIDKYEKGENTPSIDRLEPLAAALDLDVQMLIDALIQDYRNTLTTGVFNVQPAIDTPSTPPISAEISYPQAPIFTPQDIENYVKTNTPYPASSVAWRPVPSKIFKSSLFFYSMQGDSMTSPAGGPSIPSGAMVLIDRAKEAEPGQIVLATAAGGRPSVRVLIEETGTYLLKSLNPAYPLTPADNCQIHGIAIRTELDL